LFFDFLATLEKEKHTDLRIVAAAKKSDAPEQIVAGATPQYTDRPCTYDHPRLIALA
jgi:hypothetical protein